MNAAQLSALALAGIDDDIRAGTLSDLKALLFTNNPALSDATLLADLTEPTYTGYARQTITIKAARKDATGNRLLDFGLQTWQPSADPVAPVIVIGYAVLWDAAGTPKLLQSEKFAAPQTLAAALSAFDTNVIFKLPNSLTYGGLAYVG